MKSGKRWFAVACAALLLCAAGAGRAFAGGVGFSFNVGGGSGEEKWETLRKDDVDTSRVGLAFVYDSNPMGNTAFNYRINAGLESLQIENKKHQFYPYDYKTKLGGIVLENDFGFGGKVAPNIRLWGGPSIRVSYHRGEDDTVDENDYRVFGFGLGPVIGMNIALNDGVAFAPKVGVMANWYGGKAETPGGAKFDYRLEDTVVFFDFGILFRTGR